LDAPFAVSYRLLAGEGGGTLYMCLTWLFLGFKFNVFLFTLPTALVFDHTRMELWQSDNTAFGGCLVRLAFAEG
jgi:hypothetical protein